jgi:hypothetical protein
MSLLDEIYAIASNPNFLRQNLENARPPIKEIIFFCLGDHSLDLPTEALQNLGDIGQNNQNPRADALALEAFALTRVFVPEQNKQLDRPRRIQILKDILKCCTKNEREFLLNAIRTRTIPGISRQAVLEAYGPDWLKPRPPQGKTVMPKMESKKVDKRQEYIPFKDLKSLGYVQ